MCVCVLVGRNSQFHAFLFCVSVCCVSCVLRFVRFAFRVFCILGVLCFCAFCVTVALSVLPSPRLRSAPASRHRVLRFCVLDLRFMRFACWFAFRVSLTYFSLAFRVSVLKHGLKLIT